jgi:excisionase family DNA binding protein
MSQDELLTTSQVAEELKIDVKTVRKWINNGELEASDLGREYRVRRRDLEAFLESRKQKRKKRRITDAPSDGE